MKTWYICNNILRITLKNRFTITALIFRNRYFEKCKKILKKKSNVSRIIK